jgi:hypothetical protein
LDESLIFSTGEIIERPVYETAPDVTPIYCRPTSEPQVPPPTVTKIFYTVIGEGHHKQAYQAALEEALKPGSIKYEPFTIHSKALTIEMLGKILAKETAARVLWVSVADDGKVYVSIFDQYSKKTDGLVVDCPGCDTDARASKAKAAALIDRCLAPSCETTASSARRPPEACQPYTSCGGPTGTSLLLTESTPISPAQARRNRILTGLAWGTFAASAAASLTLFGLDQTSLGTSRPNGTVIEHTLSSPAAGLAVTSGLMLAVAIPATLWLDRGGSGASSTSANAGVGLSCPQ